MARILSKRHVLALAAAVWMAWGGNAAAQTLSVGVFADQYIAAGRSYDDLNALEAAVRRLGVTAVRLDGCGAADSIAQRAAAHRLRDLYVEMRVLDRTAPDCEAHLAAYVMPARALARDEPSGIDRRVVDAWWHALMP